MSPSFSVVIPTFERARVLPRALDSVLGQTFEDFELIVVDDGSSDDTDDVVAGIDDPRVRYVRQHNRGRSAARNRGVELARAPRVTFLDSDDEALPHWLADFDAGFREAERVGIVCIGFLRRDPDGSQQEVLPRRLGPLFGAPGHRGLFMARTFAVRRDLFLEVGGYAEELAFSESTELAMRLVPRCLESGLELVSLASTGSIYHADRAGGESLATRRANLASSEYILSRHEERLRREPHVHGLFLGVAGVRAARVGDFSKARRYFRRAIRVDPRNWRHCLRFLLGHVPAVARIVWSRSDEQGAEVATGREDPEAGASGGGMP